MPFISHRFPYDPNIDMPGEFPAFCDPRMRIVVEIMIEENAIDSSFHTKVPGILVKRFFIKDHFRFVVQWPDIDETIL